MPIIHKATDVNVPVRVAYDQWTQFEEFPRFMEGVEYVRQIDAHHVCWNVELGGKTREWVAEITERVPDQKIAWRSTSGASSEGSVGFERLGSSRCRIHLHLHYGWEDANGTPFPWLVGVLTVRAARDLERFKRFVELRKEPEPTRVLSRG